MNTLFIYRAILTIIWTQAAMPSIALSKSIEDDEDASSAYMIQLSRSENITSSSTIRVKIFPHERDYQPHGRDEILDSFTIHSENPCSIFKASKDQILAGALVAKNQHSVTLRAQELQTPVIIDCAENFSLSRNFGAARRELTYSGLLYVQAIQRQDRTLLEAINVVSLRGYLRGVVPSEVYPTWPEEALKTQAVAARTYALYHLMRARRFVPNRLWDVDDTVMFQAYTGITHQTESTDAAVFGTEGQILMYQGQVIQAFYHADSGGATEEASTIWRQPAPFTISRSEASDIEMSKSLWEKTFSLKDLANKLQELEEFSKDRHIVRVVVPMAGQTPSGRVKTIAVIDQKGDYTLIAASVFKRAVGGLPSNLFNVSPGAEPGQFQVSGLGAGHGVGMSQQGAAALAQRKAWNYKQILDYYYVKTSLCTIDSDKQQHMPDCTLEAFKYTKQVAIQLPPR